MSDYKLSDCTPGEWLYRPEHYDDWGMVRAAGDRMPVASAGMSARIPDDQAELDMLRELRLEPTEVRANGTRGIGVTWPVWWSIKVIIAAYLREHPE